MSVITLTLLHPLKSVAVQKWQFDPNTVIRVGRASDNDVILYSAVVSRHHLEIRPWGKEWALINLGSNGTFINGKKVNKVILKDGMVIRLASSGPKIKINISESPDTAGGDTTQRPQRRVTGRDSTKETMLNKDTVMSKETVISE